jgi:hypothetical protein
MFLSRAASRNAVLASHKQVGMRADPDSLVSARRRDPREKQLHAIYIFPEVAQMKRAILTVATLSAVWFLVSMAPDIRRYWRIRSM